MMEKHLEVRENTKHDKKFARYILPLGEVEEVEIELTGICNLKCPLCTRNYSHAKHQLVHNERSLEDIMDQLDKYPNLSHVNVAGTVSEPTLYKDIYPFLVYLVQRNVSIDFYTNASVLDLEFWVKVGRLFNKQDQRVIFTICGNTQELHEKYRKGSKLKNVLANARVYQETNRNYRKELNKKNQSSTAHMQFIVFEYNKHLLGIPEHHEDSIHHLLNQFDHQLVVESEGDRRENSYNKEFDSDVRPPEIRDEQIKSLFKRGKRILEQRESKGFLIECKSWRQGRIYINQFGDVYACYNIAEFYPEKKLQYVEKEYIHNGNPIVHDGYDFTEIYEFQNEECFKCERSINRFIREMDLDFVC